ncbi:MAG: hypothetical protein RL136_2362 [Planctomycetota bacterium]|jgi:hypothetical protein
MRIGASALAAIVGLAIAAFVLAAMPPVARALLPDDADARGEAFEQALAAALTKVRPEGEEWAIAVDPADINAWLATRLPKWIDHDPALAPLADAVDLRVASIRDALVVEDAGRALGDAVLSLPVEPRLEGDRLHLSIGTARIGRLPVPGSGSAIASLLGDGLAQLAAGPARIPLADGRAVELRAIECDPGRIALLFRTRPAPP